MLGPRFMIGEEVIRDGRTYVVAGRQAGPYGVRLLAASDRHGGAKRIVWADERELSPVEPYLAPRDDTGVPR